MSVGIFTFHRAINAGASLQAYALQTFLRNNGLDAEIVDFVPNSDISKPSFKRLFLHKMKCILSSKTRKKDKLAKRYDGFRKKYIKLSAKTYNGDSEMLRASLDYDCLISGSDQILNLTLSNNSISYYLPFKYHVNKISYASSFGRSEISSNEKEAIKKYLVDFKELSFREESGYNIVYKEIGLKQRNIVVDPVFLLSKEEWNNLLKPKKRKKYMLAYCMEYSPWMEKTIIDVHKKNPELELLLLVGSNCNYSFPFKTKKTIGADPLQFLSLIQGAEIIITNSFHGLSFSIIFGKEVYCCSHSSRNARLTNLLSIICEKEKLIEKDTTEIYSIKLDGCPDKLNEVIKASKNYLLQAINGETI